MADNFMTFADLIQAKNPGECAHITGKMREVFHAVCYAGENGITTRAVADMCDLSVYSARNWLMKLEQEGRVYKKVQPRNSTWYCY
jgi:hypothetical protein